MKRIIALTDFQVVMPAEVLSQTALLQLAAHQHSLAGEIAEERLQILFRRFGVKPAQISERAIESKEFPLRHHDILDRTKFYGERAHRVLLDFYKEESAAPDHIIHVTCTGYISPSPAQRLVTERQRFAKTKVTHAYHMGCYASLPAIRLSEGLVSAGEKSVDIVHTEMCSLHFNANDNSPEQFVVQSLFADGHVKYSAVPFADAKSGFCLLGVSEAILPDSQHDITWMPASWGMKMTLSRDVPEKIAGAIREFVIQLIRQAGCAPENILSKALFAIHPGGPRIIDVVQQTLELNDLQVQASRDVLRARGNMSSATLPHVWHKIIEEKKSPEFVLSLAFGPGMTVFGALFEAI
jgi:predicted naringenin-chalcone synthase